MIQVGLQAGLGGLRYRGADRRQPEDDHAVTAPPLREGQGAATGPVRARRRVRLP